MTPPTTICNVVLGLSLVCLLGFVPGCDFIEDLMGGGGEETADGGVAAATSEADVPQPPPVETPAVPDAAAAQVAAAQAAAQAAAAQAAMADGGVKLADGAVAALPPGFDLSKLPPGFDVSKLPPGFDPSKLPPGVDPADLASGNVPATAGDGGAAAAGDIPDITADLPAGTKLPENIDESGLPPAAALLPPPVKTQLAKALAARKMLTNQINRLNYVIDRNLTKNPADVVRLNRYIRAKRQLDSRLNQMAKQYNIPPEVLRQAKNQ